MQAIKSYYMYLYKVKLKKWYRTLPKQVLQYEYTFYIIVLPIFTPYKYFSIIYLYT